MWPDRVSYPGPLTLKSGVLPTAPRGQIHLCWSGCVCCRKCTSVPYCCLSFIHLLSVSNVAFFKVCNSYIMVCPPVEGDDLRALASTLSSVQADKP